MTSDITRREALRRAALLLGGTLAAPTIAGVLAGCGEGRARGDTAGASTAAARQRTLTPEQRAAVVAIAEAIIPTTDTPGAKDAHVDDFVDALITEYYPPEERQRFLSGLARLEARARRLHGQGFVTLDAARQQEMVAELDRLAFAEPPKTIARAPAPSSKPEVRQGGAAAGRSPAGPDSERVGTPPDDEDIGRHSFFRMMKELAVVGYYTSEVGATRELRVNPMTRYRDIPYTAGTPSWA